MRILMMTTSYPLFEGDGTAPFVQDIARGVAALGHEVDLVLPAHPLLNRPPEQGLTFHPFEYSPLASLRVWGYALSMTADRHLKWRTLLVAPFALAATRRALSSRLMKKRYDAVHVHWVVPNGYMACGPSEASGTPLIVSLHGSDVAGAERSRLAGRAARRAFEVAHSVTACSRDLRNRALKLGATEQQTHLVPYGVDAGFFGTPPQPGSTMRARLGASPTQTLVVAVGRLVEKKGFKYLIEAAAAAPSIHVAIIGDGDLDGALRARASQTRASVTMAGQFSRDEIREALSVADIVVVPSVIDSGGNVDGLPNTLLEAMAAGKAIVASRVAGIPDVVTDGCEGLLTPPMDAAALGRAMTRLAGNHGLREDLGRRASERVQRDLTWAAVARTFDHLYQGTRGSEPR